MPLDLPQHSRHPFCEVREDKLLIGGEPVDALAQRVGRTPFYVYDRAAISSRIAQLRAALPPAVSIHYAIKANPMSEVVAHVRPQVDGLDVASAGEMKIALAAGGMPGKMSFAGPGKTEAELEAAVAAGVMLNVESPRELRLLKEIGARTGRRPRYALRVNPDFELKSSGMKMAGGPKQFGIDAEAIPALLREVRDWPLDFVGFHIFSGSQNLRAEAIAEAQAKALDLAVELAAHAPAPVRSLNIGGGFGIPYFPGEQPLDLRAVAQSVARISSRTTTLLPHAELVLELGRYLVGEAGFYVCRVIDRKLSRGSVFLVTDGGLHHHLAASGNFGQVIRKNYPVIVGNRVRGTEREIASVVGPLCTPLDLLADRMDLAKADVGDLVVVLQSGAYGFSASPTRFLGHPEPLELCR
ncbi:MAG TPA: pyridoxal-dependent decarboxylase, exosortase A system-associated [Steroidobacteraceae bacterium]|nr:pyridoxal-dependent decarboxylase, exosortase A system-associated [Steroidobacteraceae bacterium]